MRAALACAMALAAGSVAFAVGSDDDAPPVPTETTEVCEEGLVWDAELSACVAIEEAGLSEDAALRAVRELAHFGRPADARALLLHLEGSTDERVLTYLGFTARLLGNQEEAMLWYATALSANPDNLLARSYRGMALLEAGDIQGAWQELIEIRERGGAGTWPDRALAQAIRTGNPITY